MLHAHLAVGFRKEPRDNPAGSRVRIPDPTEIACAVRSPTSGRPAAGDVKRHNMQVDVARGPPRIDRRYPGLPRPAQEIAFPRDWSP